MPHAGAESNGSRQFDCITEGQSADLKVTYPAVRRAWWSRCGSVVAVGSAGQTVPQTVGNARKESWRLGPAVVVRRCGSLGVGGEELVGIDAYSPGVAPDEPPQVKLTRYDV